ncbi:MAG: N-acetylglucosamine kinase [Chitinophagales bacterium]|nr:hypothetical protein [Chitinophagales bacterium]HAE14192.1 N-acetylglucosamine kinase [Bacteroidota bacterium]MCB9021898.1 N-acetylglucosamine kinase [Chitinophagales bacterium]MCB9030851.1 N-acetylglucosamine kinase [Chitinophagales bacterium]HPE96844.1 hypothetical protein [Chitinophagales bacterium]
MILIADSGSTKTNWALLKEATQAHTFSTAGFNPNYSSPEAFEGAVREVFSAAQAASVSAVYFYGSGAGNLRNDAILQQLLGSCFVHAEIRVFNDLMAACRGLAGNQPGVVCILGTGSNACLYDGVNMSHDQYSLGYLLGDEGSGFAFGKRMLAAYLYEQMPADLMAAFSASYPVTRDAVLHMAYQEQSPNKHIAGYSRFCSAHADHPWMAQQISDELERFYQAFLRRSETSGLPVHATGSVAAVFEDQLRKVCSSHGRLTGQIHADPLPGLIRFHQQKH